MTAEGRGFGMEILGEQAAGNADGAVFDRNMAEAVAGESSLCTLYYFILPFGKQGKIALD